MGAVEQAKSAGIVLHVVLVLSFGHEEVALVDEVKGVVYWRNSCAFCWLPSDQMLSELHTVLTNLRGV